MKLQQDLECSKTVQHSIFYDWMHYIKLFVLGGYVNTGSKGVNQQISNVLILLIPFIAIKILNKLLRRGSASENIFIPSVSEKTI